MSFVETAAAGRAFIHKGDLPPEGNHELVATGLANLAGAFFHSMPGGGGTSQTAVNQDAGACSQISGLVTAAVIMATLLFLAPLFGLIPNWGMNGYSLRSIRRWSIFSVHQQKIQKR